MMFTVSIDIDTNRPLTPKELEDVAELGGVATGHPGEHQIGATMTIEASGASSAAVLAAERVLAITPGTVTGCESLTVEEFDRRLAAGAPW
jgi:hypothetical protein